MHKINDKFKERADRVSEWLGRWWFSTVSLLVLALWTAYGAAIISQQVHDWFTSPQFNFPLNTITTVAEWFIGALTAAGGE
jgi:uncharacterized membrane protein